MATFNVSDSKWVANITPTTSNQTIEISTGGTYVDRDIKIDINAIPSGAFNTDIFTTTPVHQQHLQIISAEGYINNDHFLDTITLPDGLTTNFKLNDGIYTWTINKDANGNVSVY